MRSAFTPFLIRSPTSWDKLSQTLLEATDPRASQVRYIVSRELRSEDRSSVDVVRSPLTGEADFQIDVYWGNRCPLGDDAVAYRIAKALGTPVFVPHRDVQPDAWLRVTHDGDIYTPVHLNAEMLARARKVAYESV